MTKTKPTTATRRTLEDFPALIEAREKLNALTDQRRELQRTVDAEHARLEKIRNSSRVPLDRVTVSALQLLDSTPTDDPPPPLDIAALNSEIAILDRAIQIQQERVEKAKQQARLEARADYLTQHKQSKARLLAAAQQLQAAVHEERQFQTMLEAEDIGLGHPLESLGNVQIFGGNGVQSLIDCYVGELEKAYLK